MASTITGLQVLFQHWSGQRVEEDCIKNDNCVLSLGRTVIKVCTWTFARHGSWNRADCHAGEQHFPLLLLLVVVAPWCWWTWTHFHSPRPHNTLSLPSLPLAPADATFSCGQRLHCSSHLRLISAKSCVLVSG